MPIAPKGEDSNESTTKTWRRKKEPRFLGLARDTHVFGTVGALIAFVCGAALLYSLLAENRAAQRAKASWVKVPATITSIELHENGWRRASRYWLTTYRYTFGGREYLGDRFSFGLRKDPWGMDAKANVSGRLHDAMAPESFEVLRPLLPVGRPGVGDDVIVFVNPADPTQSARGIFPLSDLELASQRNWRVGMMIISGIAFGFFVIGIFQTRPRAPIRSSET